MFVVKTLLDNDGGESLLANLNLKLCTKFCIFSFYKSHTNTFVCRYCMIASSYLSDLFAIKENGIPETWNGLVLQLEANDSTVRTFRFLFFKRPLSN